MIKSVFFYLLIPALVATSFITGYTWHKAGTESELSDVIDWNTKQIHRKSVPKAIPLGMMNSDEPIEDDDVPHTFEQVNKDQQEVDRGIRAAASNNLFQNETLHNILEKLKGSII
jgi:hypothetical protein